MNLIIFFTLFSSFSVFANSKETSFDFLQKASATDKNVFENSNELKHDNETTFEDFDKDLGIIQDAHYTGLENSQLTFSIHLSSNIAAFSEVSSFEGQYSYKLKDFQDSWVSLMLKQTSANYSAVAEEIVGSQSANPNANSNTIRGDELQLIFTTGIGIGHRFKLFTSGRFFEKVSAFATLNFVTDSTTNDQYQGFGFISEYALYYRSAKSFFYGTKVSYNVMALERAAVANEGLDDRSLVFGHTSLAFELGYFY